MKILSVNEINLDFSMGAWGLSQLRGLRGLTMRGAGVEEVISCEIWV